MSASTRIKLCHTQRYSLLDHFQRTTFLEHLIALIRYLAEVHGNVGHLRLPGNKIHRDMLETLATLNIDEEGDDTIAAPSWKILDFAEETWIEENDNNYRP